MFPDSDTMNSLAVFLVIVASASCRSADLSRYGYDYGQSSGTNNEGFLNVDPGSSYGPAPYVPASYVPASYGPAPYVPASYGPASYVPAPYVPRQYVPASYVPATYVPSAYGPLIASENSKSLALNTLLSHQKTLLGAQNTLGELSGFNL